MKVALLIAQPYHDTSEILGCYSTIEKAKEAYPGQWNMDGYYVTNWRDVVAELKPDDDYHYEMYLIYELEVK